MGAADGDGDGNGCGDDADGVVCVSGVGKMNGFRSSGSWRCSCCDGRCTEFRLGQFEWNEHVNVDDE